MVKNIKKVIENNRQGIYEYDNECNEIEEQIVGVIGVFIVNKLRAIDKNIEIQEENQQEAHKIILDEEVM